MSTKDNTTHSHLKSTGNFYVPIDIFDRPEITELIGHYGMAGTGYWLRIMAVLTAGCGKISKTAAIGAGLTVGLSADKWREVLALMQKIGIFREVGDYIVSDIVTADQIKANAKQSYWREKKRVQRVGNNEAVSGRTVTDSPDSKSTLIELSEEDIPF